MAGLDRCLCGLSVPAPRSRSVAEEKGGGPGADSVSADSAEGGQGHGEGGMPGAFGEAVLAPRISERTKFSPISLDDGSTILIASWPPVVENRSDGGAVDPAALLSSKSSFYFLAFTSFS
ncbi:KRAB domain-containing zinc finger protein [Sarotherodon galilaeus]